MIEPIVMTCHYSALLSDIANLLNIVKVIKSNTYLHKFSDDGLYFLQVQDFLPKKHNWENRDLAFLADYSHLQCFCSVCFLYSTPVQFQLSLNSTHHSIPTGWPNCQRWG